MSTGQRMKYFRKRKGLNQQELGVLMGFTEATADVRIAQYEKDRRFPRDSALEKMAQILDVSTIALSEPNIDSYIGVMHTLFTLEDMYGLTITMTNGQPCLILDPNHPGFNEELLDRFYSWSAIRDSLMKGSILKDDYDDWRYKYPEVQADVNKAALDAMRAKLKAMEEAFDNGDDIV